MGLNRRDFLKNIGAVGLGTAVAGVVTESAEASHGPAESDQWMGMLVDIPKCIGCRRCEFACKEAAQIAAEARGETLAAEKFQPEPLSTFEDKSVFNGQLRRPGPHDYTKINQFDNPRNPALPVYSKVNCLHCNDPACVSACLVGAFRKLDDGPVIYDAWKCMGCRYCMVACPHGIPTYEYENLLTPQVRKCTFCADEGNPYKGKVPACMKICPAEVMTYGKRSELVKVAHEKIKKEPDVYIDHVYGEHEVGGSSWLYLAPKGFSFEELGFVKLDDAAPPRRTEATQHAIFKGWVPPVAWYGLLGAMMWVSRPQADKAEAE